MIIYRPCANGYMLCPLAIQSYFMFFITLPNKNKKFVCYKISPPYDRNKLFSFVDSLLPDISVEIHDQKIEIVYDARFVTPEAIEKLFTEADFVLNRETPFEREFSLLNKIVNMIFTVFSPFVWVIFKLIDLVFRLSKNKKKH